MITVQPIRTLPENFSEFVQEIAQGIGALYGGPAGASYRRQAARHIQLGMQQLGVTFYAAFDGIDAAGIASTIRRGPNGYVSFIHVLGRYAGEGIEALLVRAAVEALRGAGATAIVAENVDFCALALDGVYEDLRFKRVPRQLMKADSATVAAHAATPGQSVACAGSLYNDVARIICDAYAEHPGRDLHPEVQNLAGAREFVRLASTGSFGACNPAYIRVIQRGGRPVAAIVGCEAAPEVGFVLQVTVARVFQGRGMGTRLLGELAREFQIMGLLSIVLGVTLANPARELYEKIGFAPAHAVTAYVWWGRTAADAPPNIVPLQAGD